MRPFTDILRDIRKGRVVDALTDELAAVVRDVMDSSKPGEVILKLKVTPQGRHDNAVKVNAKVTSKRPTVDLPEGLFFADADGALLRDDPTQQRIFVDTAGDKIDARTGEVIDDAAA